MAENTAVDQMQSSHAGCIETRVLICKESLGLLSNHQTGCWPCSKQACKLLTAECQAAKAGPHHTMGTAPKAWRPSVFQHTPSAVLPALQPHAPSSVRALGPETLLLWRTQAPLFSNTTGMNGGSFLWFFPQVLERKASQSSCLTDQLWEWRGLLAESQLVVARPKMELKGLGQNCGKTSLRCPQACVRLARGPWQPLLIKCGEKVSSAEKVQSTRTRWCDLFK